MRNSTRLMLLLTLVIAGLFLVGTVYAGNDEAKREGFVDLNGDGFNDNMKDDDADGIPNCIDEDYVKEGNEGKEGSEGTANKNGNNYAYNFQYKPQPKHMLQSCHVLFAERQAQINGETPTEPMGNAGALGDGTFNPGMSDIASQVKPEGAGHNGGK